MGDGIDTQHRHGEFQERLDQIERDIHRILAAMDGAPDANGHLNSAPYAPNGSIARHFQGSSAGAPSAPAAHRWPTPGAAAIPRGFDVGRARFVRNHIRQRRQRERHFAADLFADPAWDMMLDLYAAHYEGRAVSVSSLCIAAAVPATTALRWIKTLVDEGLFIRIADPDDGRRIHVHLADDTRHRLDDYFDDFEG